MGRYYKPIDRRSSQYLNNRHHYKLNTLKNKINNNNNSQYVFKVTTKGCKKLTKYLSKLNNILKLNLI